jgi:uncharacterized protein YbjT (DUF2867 family)
VLNAVLADGKFTPRAVTRNLDSDSSKALIAKGVKVVKANLFDKESVKEALKGSDIVFGVRLGEVQLVLVEVNIRIGHELLGSRSLPRRPYRQGGS